MLDNSFKEYLDEEFGRIMPEQQEKYREMFKKLGFGEVNQDFVEFWCIYSDEIYGETEALRENLGLPDNYFSLLHDELDDYILYDKNTDEVFFVEADAIQNFIENKEFSKHWDSFEGFIKEYLNYNS